MIYFITNHDTLLEVKINASKFLDFLIKDPRYTFSFSCLENLENMLLDSIQDLNKKEFPIITKNILLSYVTNQKLNKWGDLINLLFDNYIIHKNNQTNNFIENRIINCSKENMQIYLDIINTTLECCRGIIGDTSNSEVIMLFKLLVKYSIIHLLKYTFFLNLFVY